MCINAEVHSAAESDESREAWLVYRPWIADGSSSLAYEDNARPGSCSQSNDMTPVLTQQTAALAAPSCPHLGVADFMPPAGLAIRGSGVCYV